MKAIMKLNIAIRQYHAHHIPNIVRLGFLSIISLSDGLNFCQNDFSICFYMDSPTFLVIPSLTTINKKHLDFNEVFFI